MTNNKLQMPANFAVLNENERVLIMECCIR